MRDVALGLFAGICCIASSIGANNELYDAVPANCTEVSIADEDTRCGVYDIANFTLERLDRDHTCCDAVCFWRTENAESPEERSNETCFELSCFTYNSSVQLSLCKREYGNESNISTEASCNSIFSSLNYWGANMVVFANIVYIIPYFFVVIVYTIVPDLRGRAYDKAVICYNVSQIILNGVLIGIGLSILCHTGIAQSAYAPLGLIIMFVTISSTFWLCVICFDMTLVITRFRWAPSAKNKREDENRKFWVYAAYTWGLTSIPVAFAAIVELSPYSFISESSMLRPNFHRFNEGPNLAVIVYVITLPALSCMTNSVLFLYTTYKMIVMKKATAMATASSTKAKKSYFVFLRLYLLMDAPWITGALGSIFPDLWLLKFLRMVQPVLMLFAILPRRALTCSSQKEKKKDPENVNA